MAFQYRLVPTMQTRKAHFFHKGYDEDPQIRRTVRIEKLNKITFTTRGNHFWQSLQYEVKLSFLSSLDQSLCRYKHQEALFRQLLLLIAKEETKL